MIGHELTSGETVIGGDMQESGRWVTSTPSKPVCDTSRHAAWLCIMFGTHNIHKYQPYAATSSRPNTPETQTGISQR